jgi:DNA-directed RNA polymerase specialized sigma24 family protein
MRRRRGHARWTLGGLLRRRRAAPLPPLPPSATDDDAADAREAAREEREVRAAVARLRAGDRAAMRVLFDVWFARAYVYVRAIVADPHGAGAVVEEAFLRLAREAAEVDLERTPPRRWLVDALHACAAEAGLASDAAAAQRSPGCAALRAAVDSARRAELVSDLDLIVLVDRLPLPERRALLLLYVVGLDGDAAAGALGCSPEQLREHESAGVAGVRERLDAFGRSTCKGSSRVAMRQVAWGSPVLNARGRAILTRAS